MGLLITYIDYNNFKNYFYSWNNFFKYMEFNTEFPGIYDTFEDNKRLRFTVAFNSKHDDYQFVQFFYRPDRQPYAIKNLKTDSGISIRGFIDPQVSEWWYIAPGQSTTWWLVNPETFAEIVGLYTGEFTRDYFYNYIELNKTTGLWTGIDTYHTKTYNGAKPEDVLLAIFPYWTTEEIAKINIKLV